MKLRWTLPQLKDLGFTTVVRIRDCSRGRSVAVLNSEAGALYVAHGVRFGKRMEYSQPWRFANLVEVTVTLTQLFGDVEGVCSVRLTMAETIRKARAARRS